MSSDKAKVNVNGLSIRKPSGLRISRLFVALRHYNFRLFWFGQLISLIGTWMQNVAQGWLVLQLTNSPLLLGLVSAAAATPILLFSPLGGVVADKFSKRKLIIITQTLVMLLAFLLSALILTGKIHYWQILVIAFFAGTVMALDAPSRQSFVVEMVGKEDLLNAIALNSSIFNTARIVGPAIAGIIISTVGIGLCYLINGFSFIPVIIGLLLMRGKFLPVGSEGGSFLEDLHAGIIYVKQDRRILSFLTLVASSSIFVMPYLMLMPVFARDILRVGARGLGTLLAAAGIGALAGALTLASLGNFKKKGRLVLVGTVTFTTAIFFFTISRSFVFSLLLLIAAGWGMVTQNASINTLLQTTVADFIRGRVMSLYTFTFMGMMPIGSLLAGIIANYLGAEWSLRIGTILVAIILYAIFSQRKEIFDF